MDSIEDMFTVMNEVAPEHLEIQLPDPMNYMTDKTHNTMR